MDIYYSVKEIQKMFKVGRQAVWLWIKGGKLKAYKIGKFWRVKKQDLDEFSESQCNRSNKN